ncbi:MAG: hypothetical protein ACJ74T_03580, partial [Pyrinomonadaceae bacterium]
RDHYHVFAFNDGHPPPAELVDKILGKRTKQAQADKPEKAEQKETKKKETKKKEAPAKKGRKR